MVGREAVGGRHPLPVRIEVGLYRIAQESLTNVVRHANARHATLRLVTTPDQIQLTIEDDGRGFDPSQVPEGQYGPVGMNERARLLGEMLRVESCPGEGTCVQVEIPLEGKREQL